MTHIISAFPATGKTWYYKSIQGCSADYVMDSDSSKFSWLDHANGERNPAFPDNYMDHIKSYVGSASIILVSTHQTVRDALFRHGLNFTLVYPSRHLKEDYVERIRKRGSPSSLANLIEDNWYRMLDEMDKQVGCGKIVLNSGQYLSDVIDQCTINV